MTVDRQSQTLRYSGDFWTSRLASEQLPLARQLAGLLPNPADTLSQIGSWLNGEPTDTALHVWALLPDEILTQGPDIHGHHLQFQTPAFTGPRYPDADRPRAYLSSEGVIVETVAGDGTLPEGFTLSEQTVWFIPRPENYSPVLLLTQQGPLVEGTGFIVAGNWIMLYQDPTFLWDGVVVAHCVRTARSGRSTALAADRLFSSGKQIARYRRGIQSLKQFERALCEMAGLPMLEKEGYVVSIEERPNGSLHWLDDGRQFLLPGDSPYRVGSRVDADDGHILRVRHRELQGEDWWRNRSWSSHGIPLFAFRPGFYGIAIKDTMVEAVSYEHAAGLRGRLLFDQYGEEYYWDWQARKDSLLPEDSRLASLLGFTDPGQQTRVNALDFYLKAAGPWFGVVETTLDVSNPAAFRAVLDFVDKERPSGTIFYVRGESEAFGNEQLFDVYLHTGELVYTGDNILTVRPAY